MESQSAFVKLKEKLAALDFRPTSSLGQNFLVDNNMLDAIVRDARIEPGAAILEVGPGPGALTIRLAEVAASVLALELDNRLATILREVTAGIVNIQIIEGDALDGSPRGMHPAIREWLRAHAPAGSPISRGIVVANLPYSISAPFLANLFEQDPAPARAVVLVQKEVAERIAAEPGSADFGPLSVSIQLQATTRILRTVPPGVFRPRPKVDSALLELVARVAPVRGALLARVKELQHAVFQQRRKMAARRLQPFFDNDADRVERALAAIGAAPTARGQELDAQAFLILAKASLERVENESA